METRGKSERREGDRRGGSTTAGTDARDCTRSRASPRACPHATPVEVPRTRRHNSGHGRLRVPPGRIFAMPRRLTFVPNYAGLPAAAGCAGPLGETAAARTTPRMNGSSGRLGLDHELRGGRSRACVRDDERRRRHGVYAPASRRRRHAATRKARRALSAIGSTRADGFRARGRGQVVVRRVVHTQHEQRAVVPRLPRSRGAPRPSSSSCGGQDRARRADVRNKRTISATRCSPEQVAFTGSPPR